MGHSTISSQATFPISNCHTIRFRKMKSDWGFCDWHFQFGFTHLQRVPAINNLLVFSIYSTPSLCLHNTFSVFLLTTFRTKNVWNYLSLFHTSICPINCASLSTELIEKIQNLSIEDFFKRSQSFVVNKSFFICKQNNKCQR